MLILYYFDYCNLIASLKTKESSDFVLKKIFFCCFISFHFHINCRNSLSISMRKTKNFDWDHTDSIDLFMILTIFSFPIQEHGIYLSIIGPLYFLSAIFCSFRCTGFAYLLLNLFLSNYTMPL